jgi:hypothetical protein
VGRHLLAAGRHCGAHLRGRRYRGYLNSLPAEPREQLPAQVQQSFREEIRIGNLAPAYFGRTHDVTATHQAAEYFAAAYRPHPKDPLAVQGLKVAADGAIDWYSRQPR